MHIESRVTSVPIRHSATPRSTPVANTQSIRDHAAQGAGALDMANGGDERKASVGTPTVFISYASPDAEAPQRICDALRWAGVQVWFDQSELRGGDAWDASSARSLVYARGDVCRLGAAWRISCRNQSFSGFAQGATRLRRHRAQ
jgi:TIR domain